MIPIFSTLGEIAKAISGGIQIALQAIGLRNSPEMQDAARRAKEEKEKDEDAKTADSGDLDAVRRRAS